MIHTANNAALIQDLFDRSNAATAAAESDPTPANLRKASDLRSDYRDAVQGKY